MASISFSEQQHTPDITHTSTKLIKLITILFNLSSGHVTLAFELVTRAG